MNAATKAHDRNLAIFAHELREPLSSILFAVDAMAATSCNEVTQHEMCGIIERQSRYLARLIDGVLEAESLDRKPLNLQKNWFDLNQVVRAAQESTAPLLRCRGHQLAMLLPSTPVHVLADPLRVQQIVVNLLANAAKYTGLGGVIQLSVRTDGEHAIIEVQDNGIGIEPALLPRIFDLFERGTRSPASTLSGLGVGLTLVKSLVELHRGHVNAYSDGVDAGSRFVVRLPQADAEPAKAAMVWPRERLSVTGSGLSTNPMLDA